MGNEPPATETPRWGPGRRAAFRFAFVYLLLYLLVGVFGDVLMLSDSLGRWFAAAVRWVGEKVFGVTATVQNNGSGDTTFNYVEDFCVLVLAVAATLAWCTVDRRPSHPRLAEVLRVVLRHFLAFTLIIYGSAKIVPLQFGTLAPLQLVTPVGERSPMGLLWTFMAASPYYGAFTGAIEFVAALLLLFRRTTLLGALIAAGALSHVVVLNFCYDVPVKLHSSHLLAMALVLIAPDAARLWDLFVLGRPVTPAPLRPRFRRRWLDRTVKAFKLGAFGLFALGALGGCAFLVHRMGLLDPPRPLQGVWDVAEFERDGRVVPPLTTDATRWKQVLIMRAGDDVRVTIRPMTGEKDSRSAELDEAGRRMTLKEDPEAGKPALILTYEEPAPGVLVLTATADGKPLRVTLHQVPPERFLLVSRGFHWVNETPFNR